LGDLGFAKELAKMSFDPVPSNSHHNLDEQIAQLMQCKPLSEQEVRFSIQISLFPSSFLYDGSRFWHIMENNVGSNGFAMILFIIVEKFGFSWRFLVGIGVICL